MTTKLTESLRREIEIDGEAYTVVLTKEGVRLSKKRFRGGKLITWRSLWERGEVQELGTQQRNAKYPIDG